MNKPTIGHYASHQRDVTAQEDSALNAALRSSTVKVEHPEIARLRAELAGCRALLRRCLPIIESDAQMMADLSRFAPLDPVAQATHDATEYDSERLVREIPAALAKDDAARKGEGE